MTPLQLLRHAWRRLPLSDRARWLATRVILAPVLPFIQGSTVHRAYEAEKEWRRRCIRPCAGDRAPALPPQRKPDIVFWGNIDWRFRIQRPQHLARGLSAAGHRVFYISPTFVKARGPGFELEPIDGAAGHCIFDVRLHLDARPRIYEMRPAAADLARLREDLARLFAWTQTRGAISVIQHPSWHPVARMLPNSHVVYDCMDHHMGFSSMGADVEALEHELLGQADAVVASSQVLCDAAAAHGARPALIRNAAEYDVFARPPASVYRDARGRRIIGYYGAIADWIDVDLLDAVAGRFPDCLLLLIGNDTAGARQRLAHRANVCFTGEVPYADLTHYLHGMDVCLLPFRIIPLTLATNPLKVYEYLAAGRPVAAIALPELEQFGDLVANATDTAGFLEQVAALLVAGAEPAAVAARQAFAARNTWAQRVAALQTVMRDLREPRVSIVVVTHDNLELTQACLDSIERYSDYRNLEVIVVDNASRDGTPAFLGAWQAAGTGRSIILNDTHRGFAAATNQGLARADGDYLAMLNSDTEVTSGWIRTLVNHLRRDPTIGMIGPVTDNIGNEARIDLRYRDRGEMHRAAAAYTLSHMGITFPIRTLAFYCAMMPRSVFERVGPLDEAYGTGDFEDDDYCRRIEQSGLKLLCAEDVFIRHHRTASFNKPGNERQALLEHNRAIYESKWGPWIPHRHR